MLRSPFITPHRVKVIFTGLLVLVALGYFAYLLYPTLRAPRIELWEPPGNISTHDAELLLQGRVKMGARLTVNQEGVYVDRDGNFSQPMYLASGLNVLEFTAEGKFGKKSRLIRYVVFKP